MRLLDLFCGAGGASVGYARAGFEVTGVDLEPHRDYPFPLLVADALDVLTDRAFLRSFEVIHASPPCQRYSYSTADPAQHPDLIPVVRKGLRDHTRVAGHYVIENVPGAPLLNPLILCGSAFGLQVRRHRLFETSAAVLSPGCFHGHRRVVVGVYGRHADKQAYLRPTGTQRSRGVKADSLEAAQRALGIGWMTNWRDLTDAIPPAYTQHLGGQLLADLGAAA